MEHYTDSHEKINLYTVHIRTNHRKIKEMWQHFDRVTVASKEENVLFIGIKMIQAGSRVDAAKKAHCWYWNHCKGLFGPAEYVITVSDPEEEVRYSRSFSCARRQAWYLNRETALRVVAEAKGELALRTPHPSAGYAYWQLFRLKKRRNRPSMMKVGPCILRGGSGVLYYRRTLEPQVSADGHVVVKRKIENVRLQARVLQEAYKEVIARKLRDIHRTGRRHFARARQYERFFPPHLLIGVNTVALSSAHV